MCRFPLGGFTPLQSTALNDVARALGATPMQVALAWLLQRAPNILLIPGTSSIPHLRENLAAASLELPRPFDQRVERNLRTRRVILRFPCRGAASNGIKVPFRSHAESAEDIVGLKSRPAGK